MHHFSMSWKITPLYFFSSNNINFAQKEPSKVKIFENWVSRSKYVKFLMPILKWQVDSSLNFVSLFSFIKDNSSVLFLSQTIYNLLGGTLLKWKFRDFRVLRSKFVKFLISILKQPVDFSPNFVSLFCFMKDNSSVLF